MFVLHAALSTQAPSAKSVPDADDWCGICRNGWSFWTMGYNHKFVGPPERSTAFDTTAVLRHLRVKSELPVIDDDKRVSYLGLQGMLSEDDEEIEWETAGIYFCSIDLWCHDYKFFGDCDYGHYPCFEDVAASDFLEKFSASKPSLAQLTRALAEAPSSIKINQQRSSVQFVGCQGAVIANIPMPSSMLAVASMQAAAKSSLGSSIAAVRGGDSWDR